MTEAVAEKYEGRIGDGLVPMRRWATLKTSRELSRGSLAVSSHCDGSIINVDGGLAAETDRDTYDCIITGGGSAGCVLARRLSDDPKIRVLLIEAGGSDWHPFFHMPAGFAKMTKGIGSWGWSTVPQKHLKGRVLNYTQAKVIGGGSSINAQLYTRGVPADYDDWERKAGATGWSYQDVLPYFKRAENDERFSNTYHGYGGPLGVSNPISPLPICEAFFQAGQELGIPFNPDFNGERQEGLGYYQLTQFNARSSTSIAYLNPIRERKNLTIALKTRRCASGCRSDQCSPGGRHHRH
jgi:choline dehydrogenase-like flavoprotein